MRLWLLGPSHIVEEPFAVRGWQKGHVKLHILPPETTSWASIFCLSFQSPPLLPPGFLMGFSASCPSMSVQNKIVLLSVCCGSVCLCWDRTFHVCLVKSKGLQQHQKGWCLALSWHSLSNAAAQRDAQHDVHFSPSPHVL